MIAAHCGPEPIDATVTVCTTPTVDQPIIDWDGTQRIRFCLQGDPAVIQAWDARAAVRTVASQVDGIRLLNTCDRPATYRIRLVDDTALPGDQAGEQYWGMTTPTGFTRFRVDLNPTYGYNELVPEHEFLHVLGMDHHYPVPGELGLMDYPVPWAASGPSTSELVALRAAYPVHAAARKQTRRHAPKHLGW